MRLARHLQPGHVCITNVTHAHDQLHDAVAQPMLSVEGTGTLDQPRHMCPLPFFCKRQQAQACLANERSSKLYLSVLRNTCKTWGLNTPLSAGTTEILNKWEFVNTDIRMLDSINPDTPRKLVVVSSFLPIFTAALVAANMVVWVCLCFGVVCPARVALSSEGWARRTVLALRHCGICRCRNARPVPWHCRPH